jgi:hypothetical protein
MLTLGRFIPRYRNDRQESGSAELSLFVKLLFIINRLFFLSVTVAIDFAAIGCWAERWKTLRRSPKQAIFFSRPVDGLSFQTEFMRLL